MVLLSLSEERLIILLQVMNNSMRDQLLLQEQLSEQNRDLREAYMPSLHKMEELKESPRVTSRWIEILRMLSQYAVDYPTFPVSWRYVHFIVILGDC